MLRSILCLLAFLAAWVAPATAGGRVALVVGIADYGPLGKLANPLNDAREMEKLLREKLGFEVLVSHNPDYDALQKAMTAFGRAARDADVALFFYAGHGIEFEGANYMLPVGADIRADVDLLTQGYRLDMVVDLMVRAGARFKIVLLDACRTNPLPSVARGARGLQALYATNIDTLIAFATEPGRVAYDGAGSNSPFTSGLLEYLGKPDLELQSTMRRVRKAVYAATDQKQFPWWDDMFLSDVYLGGLRATKVAEAAVGAARGALPSLEDDIALCERLGASSSLPLLESYLDRFPDGFCAVAVRKRMALASQGGGAAESVTRRAPTPPAPAPEPREARSSQSYSVSSYWDHNGSLMALSANGDSRVFYYETPREPIAKAGVTKGTLLFKGRFAGRRYTGQAYLFSRKCGPIAYEVSGQVSADFRRVELIGQRPVRDKNCRRKGTRPDHLVFEFRSKTL
jgi:hypothetical protein